MVEQEEPKLYKLNSVNSVLVFTVRGQRWISVDRKKHVKISIDRERKWEEMTRDRRSEQASSSSLRTITTEQLSSMRCDPFNAASHIQNKKKSITPSKRWARGDKKTLIQIHRTILIMRL